MSATWCLAVDTLGADADSRLWARAALAAVGRCEDLRLILLGDPDLPRWIKHARVECRPAEMAVSPMDKPLEILRRRADSSMAQALQLVAQGEAHGCVTGGHTGALTLLARSMLQPLPGIERPAICKAVPGRALCRLLDLGANTEADALQLEQFAIMGAALARVQGVAIPRVAILNMGIEPNKGRRRERDAAVRLAARADLRYCGFAEGHHIFDDQFDVVVCDGFTGNAVLKASEGAARLIAERLQIALRSGLRARLGGWLAAPALRDLHASSDPAAHNGAALLGVRGTVVKSHGGADRHGMLAALLAARDYCRGGLVEQLAAALAMAPIPVS